MFLTGEAGTGKSTLIRHFQALMPEMSITATTGTAAFLIGGQTLHSWAGLGIALNPSVESALGFLRRRKSKAIDRWKTCKCLVIDEISMLSAATFELVNKIAQAIRGNKRPFGGLQVILCGDFYQLPPVGATKYAFESAVWCEIVEENVVLKEVLRTNDVHFRQILAEARIGEISAKSKAGLGKRQLLPPIGGVQPTKLYAINRQVCDLNTRQLKQLETEVLTYDATVRKTGVIHRSVAASLIQASDEHGAYTKMLQIAIGAQVMLTVNLDVKSGLFNGSRGIVVDFKTFRGKLLPVVEFVSGCRKPIGIHWWSLLERNGTRLERGQIPLKLAWAITIHKSQGLSLDCVSISIGRDIFEYGQAYVALSRVRSLSGLFIEDYKTDAFKSDQRVRDFYKTLKCARLITDFFV